ncbi:Serine/threonine protein kinase [Fusarium oxysporum f. sp. albedinis]|nr:Serine/threonine protein kinase [Fusarium oxysporum f. sp. albedinis]
MGLVLVSFLKRRDLHVRIDISHQELSTGASILTVRRLFRPWSLTCLLYPQPSCIIRSLTVQRQHQHGTSMVCAR